MILQKPRLLEATCGPGSQVRTPCLDPPAQYQRQAHVAAHHALQNGGGAFLPSAPGRGGGPGAMRRLALFARSDHAEAAASDLAFVAVLECPQAHHLLRHRELPAAATVRRSG